MPAEICLDDLRRQACVSASSCTLQLAPEDLAHFRQVDSVGAMHLSDHTDLYCWTMTSVRWMLSRYIPNLPLIVYVARLMAAMPHANR